jgi:hypothetical protein
MQPQGNEEPDDRPERELDDGRARDEAERERQPPEDRPGEPGAEGGAQSPTRGKLPGMPAKDDPTPVGDTDQHSTG